MKNSELTIDLSDVLELMLDAVCVVDREGRFVFVSAAFQQMFGYSPDEIVGKSMLEMVYPDDLEKTLRVAESINDGEILPRFENRWVRKDGSVINVLWSARWSEKHQVRIAVAHDITERKLMEARLLHAAGHDDLTNLPNRTLLMGRLQASMTSAERDHQGVSVLFIDIDGFKDVNDNHGHAMGDVLLQQIARRLVSCVRKSDTVGRLGGDEFLVALNNVRDVQDAMQVAKKICVAIAEPFLFEGVMVSVSASIGLAHYPTNGTDIQELVQRADQAMYTAKKCGGDQVVLSAY